MTTANVIGVRPRTLLKNATATAQTNETILETGLTLQEPPYLETGDKIKVDTREYRFVSRA